MIFCEQQIGPSSLSTPLQFTLSQPYPPCRDPRQAASFFERAVGVEGMEARVVAVDGLGSDAALRRAGIGPGALQGCADLATRGPSMDLVSASPSALRGGARCGWLLRRTKGVKMPGTAAGSAHWDVIGSTPCRCRCLSPR